VKLGAKELVISEDCRGERSRKMGGRANGYPMVSDGGGWSSTLGKRWVKRGAAAAPDPFIFQGERLASEGACKAVMAAGDSPVRRHQAGEPLGVSPLPLGSLPGGPRSEFKMLSGLVSLQWAVLCT
jgi:hypothetical protein